MTVDTARDRSKTLKRRKKNEKWQKVKEQLFYFYFFIKENSYFVGKHFWKNLVYIVTFALPFFHVEDYWKCSNTNTHKDIHWFCRRHTLPYLNLYTSQPSSLKRLNFPKFAFNFPCERGNFSLIHRAHITIHSLWRTLLSF